ncbi:Uncharacterised protein [uncultured archaeon]|nr:Uncharacterised protein [uncultured archaeon]
MVWKKKNSNRTLSGEEKKFWQILLDMDEKGEHQRTFSGSVDGPCYFRAIYAGRVKMGFVDET